MQQHYLSRTFNFITVAGASLLLAYSAKQLFLDNPTAGLASPLPAIGEVASFHNQVKLRKAHLFSWKDVDGKPQINAEDVIFTYKDSTSNISLGDTELTILPETMIRLRSQDQLDLQQGVAQFQFKQKKSTFTLFMAGRPVTLSSQDAQITIRKSDQGNSIQVQSGSLEVKTDEHSYQMQSGQALSLRPGADRLTHSEFKLLAPPETVLTTENETLPVEFQFSANQPVELQLSSDINFTEPLLGKIPNAISPYSQTLAAGKYFWRLSTSEQQSQEQSFEVHYLAPAPEQLVPEHEAELTSYSLTEGVNFRWSGKAKTQFHHLEVLNADGAVLVSEIVDGLKWHWAAAAEGTYTWRVRSYEDYIQGHWTTAHSFTYQVVDYSKEAPLVIELVRPNQKVTFDWTGSSEEAVFTVATDPQFTNVYHQAPVKGNSTSLSFPKLGTYYWKVSGQTKPKSVIIRPSPPPAKPKELPRLKLKLQTGLPTSSWWEVIMPSAHAASGHVDLTWPAMNEAKKYFIEIYSDPQMQNLVTTFTSKDAIHRWKVPRPGIYYWRMSFEDHWGRISPHSDLSELEVAAADMGPKKAPKPTAPTQEIAYKPTTKYLRYQLGLEATPASIDYKHSASASDSYAIKGTALGGARLSFTTRFAGARNYGIVYHSIAGKVFEDQDFQQRQFSLNYLYRFGRTRLTAGLLGHQVTTYKTVNAEAQLDSTASAYAAMLGLEYNFSSLFLKAHHARGSLVQSTASVGHRLRIAPRFHWITEASYSTWELALKDETLESTNAQIGMGLYYLF